VNWWDSLLQSETTIYILAGAAIAALITEGLSALRALEQAGVSDDPPPLLAPRPSGLAAGDAGRTTVRDLHALWTSEPRARSCEHRWVHIGGGLYHCEACGIGGGDSFATPRDPVLTRDQARDDVRKRLVRQQEGRR
jgi:hypothetical protein